MFRFRALFALGILAPAGVLFGQTMNTGSLLGTVKDPTGAGVPEAMVTVQRTGTPFERQVTTDAGGNYLVPQAPVGSYRISFEKTGFQKVTHSQVELSAGQSLRVVRSRMVAISPRVE